MKTNAADKKGKKQTVGGASVSVKPGQKKPNAAQSKGRSMKAAHGMGNGHGRFTFKSKEQALKEIAEDVKQRKQKTSGKQQNDTVGPAKQEMKTHAKDQAKSAETKRDAKDGKKQKLLEKSQAKRALARERGKRERKNQFADLNAEQLKSKIEQIVKRGTLSKTAKRKLSVLNKRLNLIESGTVLKKADVTEKSNKKGQQEEKSEETVKSKQEVNVDKTKAKTKPQDKKAKIEVEEDDVSDEVQTDVEEEEEDDDDDDVSMEIDDADSIDDSEEESDDDESDEEIVNEEESKKINQKKAIVQLSPNQKKGGMQNKHVGKFQKGGKATGATQGKKKPWKKGNFRGPKA